MRLKCGVFYIICTLNIFCWSPPPKKRHIYSEMLSVWLHSLDLLPEKHSQCFIAKLQRVWLCHCFFHQNHRFSRPLVACIFGTDV